MRAGTPDPPIVKSAPPNPTGTGTVATPPGIEAIIPPAGAAGRLGGERTAGLPPAAAAAPAAPNAACCFCLASACVV
eukprot:CAMPEP_0180103186 /NCGR_PEP_ID=MMETSP0985-20121206/30629_1 /TAXON_ID=483367 /ORGANISM="non described non described, Strain CCMP 2436" /LENGTH=76 /DNA_ID=CAMNT_0022039635 /DNA_START=421 /DNA_END=651 /DNA_ORIENTATION=-